MLLRTIKFTFRLIKRDKFHYGMNILGLSFGIACCLVIFLFLQHEMTYDRYHENSDRIYRIYSTYLTSGDPIRFGPTSPALGPRLKQEFPEIEEYVRIVPFRQFVFTQKEKNTTVIENNIALADPSIFKVFSYEFILGNPETCLDNPQSIVLTQPLAQKYFGHENPIGKMLQVDGQNVLEVTGVIKTPPPNSHLTIDGIVPFKSWDRDNRSLEWSMFEIFGYTYVRLPKSYDFTSFHEKWPAFYEKYCAEDAKSYGQIFKPIFQKLTDIRYDPTPIRGNVAVGSRSYLNAFFIVGIFILLLACINYINLTTARSTTRAKEVGIKKVLGSEKKTLIFQILGESFIITFLAILISFVLVEIFQSIIPVERLLGFDMQVNLLKNPLLLTGILGLFVFIGLTSGLYPALHFSAILPTKALSGILRSGKKGLLIRRILVSSQFTISLGVIVLMLFMYDQVNFMRNKNLGFIKENVVSAQIQGPATEEKINTLKQELMSYPGVLSVTHGWNWPGRPSTGLYMFEGNEGIEEHNYYVLFVGYDYLETLGLELASGRDFDRQHPSDPSSAVLVNETLVKALEWDNPLGKLITQNRFRTQVIGVVKDFNYRSLHNEIEPLIIRFQPNYNNSAMIMRIQGSNVIQTMAFLENKWKEVNPNRPFDYGFLDEDFGRLYRADLRQNSLLKLFSYVCVFVSLLGLFGLSSFNAIRRTKEIAIRKVHGASSVRIVAILFKEIFFMVLIAAAVVFPVSLILMNEWLKNFAYRTDLNAFLFIGTAAGALLVAFITASYHCIKVARSNPVKALRHE
jgi:putative ABC transport system permease protein